MKVFFMVSVLRLESVSQPFEITPSWLEPVAQNKAALDFIGANLNKYIYNPPPMGKTLVFYYYYLLYSKKTANSPTSLS